MKIYTPEEANRVLPKVRTVVERIRDLAETLPDLQDQARIAEYEFGRPGADEAAAIRVEESIAAVRSAEAELERKVEELERFEVQLKDVRQGLVDFPAYREGEQIELCWKLGEDSVSHWHHIGEGYPGRKPL